jgi:hypothetical protein
MLLNIIFAGWKIVQSIFQAPQRELCRECICTRSTAVVRDMI